METADGTESSRPRAWGLGILLLGAIGCSLSPPTPPLQAGDNPFVGRPLYMNSWSRAGAQADQWRRSRPDDAKLMEQLAAQPVSLWFGDWTPNVESAIRAEVVKARTQGALTLMVLYNVPNRDCGLYSAGGVQSADAYRIWIRKAKRGIGKAVAAVILEPDALGNLTDCLDAAGQRERLELIAWAAEVLGEGGQTAVYIDAGNAKWHPPEVMAERLRRAGIAKARGFSLNVSNYVTTEESVAYGRAISEQLGGKPFVIDTSRNGNGATTDAQWCNPRGRAVGVPPLTPPTDPGVDAYLWIKVPGESDGECNGGPAAGNWWPAIAIELARNAEWTHRAAGLAVPEPAPPPPTSSQPRPGPRR